MNATPLPLSQRRWVDLISLAAGVAAFLLALPLLAWGFALDRPGLIVLSLTAIFSAAAGGMAIGKPLRSLPEAALAAARLGARAGLLTSLLAAGMTVLAAVLSGAPRLWLIGLAAPLCVLPGALAGIAGASLAMRLLSTEPATSPPEPVSQDLPDPGGPSLLALGVVGLALFGFLSPLYLHSWRQYFPPPQPSVAPPQPNSPAAETTPGQPQASSQPGFFFEPSSDLKTIPPLFWQLADQRVLPDIDGGQCIALSHDGRFLAGLASNGAVLIDLHSLETKCRWNVSEGVQALAFSPDDQQLIYVASAQPPHVGVLRIVGSRVLTLPQPRNRLIPDTAPMWSAGTTVTFRTTGGPPLALDLATLEMDPIVSPEVWAAKPAEQRATWTLYGPSVFAQSDVWSLRPLQCTMSCELPEVEGVSDGWPAKHRIVLGIESPQGAGSQAFPTIDLQEGDRVVVSPDGSKFVCCRSTAVEVFYFRSGPAMHRSIWTVPMPHPPEQLDDLPAAQVVREKLLCAFAYPPLTNPLNDKVIGPDRNRVLASLRLVSWENESAVFATDVQSADLPDDFVVADPHIWRGGRPELLSFAGRHRWWSKPTPRQEPVDTTALPELNRQPTIVTKWEGGALRIMNTAAPNPPPELRGPGQPGKASDPPKYGGLLEIVGVQQFILTHHDKAERGDVRSLVADYADHVQFLSHGAVTRAFIEKEERAYHNEHSRVEEKVVGEIDVQFVSARVAQARYRLSSTTTLRSTGATSQHDLRLILDIQINNGRMQITSQRVDK